MGEKQENFTSQQDSGDVKFKRVELSQDSLKLKCLFLCFKAITYLLSGCLFCMTYIIASTLSVGFKSESSAIYIFLFSGFGALYCFINFLLAKDDLNKTFKKLS